MRVLEDIDTARKKLIPTYNWAGALRTVELDLPTGQAGGTTKQDIGFE